MAHNIFAFKYKNCALARYIKESQDICLMENQAKCIYKKVETWNTVNVDTTKQEIETDRLDKMGDTNGKINPYHEIITNKVEKDNKIISQMEQRLIPINIVNYIQYDRHPKNYYYLEFNAVDSKVHKKIFNKKEKREQYSREIQRWIFRHVWRNSVRSNKYYWI